MNQLSHRLINLVIFVGCVFLILTAMLFFQAYLNLEPCPLCIMQRVAVISVGFVVLIALVHNPKGIMLKLYSALALLLSLGGAAISSRHLWLQHLPPEEVPACGPGLNYVLENLELFETKDILSMMFSGTGDCSEVLWTFMGLSIPGWTLLVFIGLAGINLWQLIRKP